MFENQDYRILFGWILAIYEILERKVPRDDSSTPKGKSIVALATYHVAKGILPLHRKATLKVVVVVVSVIIQ
jgi:hypothetical protein